MSSFDRFSSYKSLLSEFKSDTPTFYKLMKIDMKDALKYIFVYLLLLALANEFFCRKISLDTSTMLKKTSTMKIDKDAIEEAARKALAEREAAASDSE